MKPIICFFIGYISDPKSKDTQDSYGSEISMINLAKIFSEKYRVVVFGTEINKEEIFENIEFYNQKNFEKFQENNNIEIFIIVRYLYYLFELDLSKAKQVYLWIHDLYPLHYYKGKEIYNLGKNLLKNTISKIDDIICLTEYHKNIIKKFYELDDDKIKIIGNGIDISKFNNNLTKQKNKFIYTSHAYRGLYKLMIYLDKIKKEIPDLKLYVYRDRSNVPDDIFDEMKKYDFVHYGGKISNDEVIKEFETSEIWFYPTQFDESYCISALEAQMAKCVCICSDHAALSETVSDRGILIKEPYSQKYEEKSISEVVKILKSEPLKKYYKEKGYEWAKNQSWENRAQEWYKLFDKK